MSRFIKDPNDSVDSLIMIRWFLVFLLGFWQDLTPAFPRETNRTVFSTVCPGLEVPNQYVFRVRAKINANSSPGSAPNDIDTLNPTTDLLWKKQKKELLFQQKNLSEAGTTSKVIETRFSVPNSATYILRDLQTGDLKTLVQNPNVISVQPDCYYKPSPSEIKNRLADQKIISMMTTLVTPNDPRLSDLWGLEKIGAQEGWTRTLGRPEIIVSINDSGLDFDHEELRANLWTNSKEIPGNNIDDDGNGCVDDIHGCNNFEKIGNTQPGALGYGHGTHVAGTVAAAFNNGKGVVGVAPGVRLMDSQAFPFSGGIGGNNTRSTMVKSIYYSVQNGARVINCSWSAQNTPTDIEIEAFKYAYDKGVTVIVAAGNEGHDVDGYMPMSLPTVIPVAATDRGDGLAEFSNFGSLISLAAPGGKGSDPVSGLPIDGIWSSYPTHLGGYKEMVGTSMAAPHVTGLVALMLSLNPKLTPTEIKQFLVNGAKNLRLNPPLRPDLAFNYGRIDVANTLRLVAANAPVDPWPTPTVSPTPTGAPVPSGGPTPTPKTGSNVGLLDTEHPKPRMTGGSSCGSRLSQKPASPVQVASSISASFSAPDSSSHPADSGAMALLGSLPLLLLWLLRNK